LGLGDLGSLADVGFGRSTAFSRVIPASDICTLIEMVWLDIANCIDGVSRRCSAPPIRCVDSTVLGHHVKVQTRKHFEHDTKRWARRMRTRCVLLAVRYLLGAHSGFAAWMVVVSNLLADDYEVLLLGTFLSTEVGEPCIIMAGGCMGRLTCWHCQGELPTTESVSLDYKNRPSFLYSGS